MAELIPQGKSTDPIAGDDRPSTACKKANELFFFMAVIDFYDGNTTKLNLIQNKLAGNVPSDVGSGFVWRHNVSDTGFGVSQLLPGDRIRFFNPYYRTTDDTYWTGSNVIYLGNGKVFSYDEGKMETIHEHQLGMMAPEAFPHDQDVTPKPDDYIIGDRYRPLLP